MERRNEIVECLEMDRKREVEEDRSIHTQMGLYAGNFSVSVCFLFYFINLFVQIRLIVIFFMYSENQRRDGW